MAGSLQFPYLPAGEVLTANLVLYAVSQKNQLPSDFPKQWLTMAAIKDARNLLVRKHMQSPPMAVIRMAAATVRVAVAACGRPRTQLQRRIASVAIRTWEPHEERLRQRLALWVRQVGRSRGGGISSEQQVPRDQYCWTELDQSVSGEIIAATILSKIAKTLKFLYRYTHLFNTKVKKRIQ